jgi:hypothetical protein
MRQHAGSLRGTTPPCAREPHSPAPTRSSSDPQAPTRPADGPRQYARANTWISMMVETYAIRGGRSGRERLRVLSHVFQAQTYDDADCTEQAALVLIGVACPGMTDGRDKTPSGGTSRASEARDKDKSPGRSRSRGFFCK